MLLNERYFTLINICWAFKNMQSVLGYSSYTKRDIKPLYLCVFNDLLMMSDHWNIMAHTHSFN